jgi:hypothetical protein
MNYSGWRFFLKSSVFGWQNGTRCPWCHLFNAILRRALGARTSTILMVAQKPGSLPPGFIVNDPTDDQRATMENKSLRLRGASWRDPSGSDHVRADKGKAKDIRETIPPRRLDLLRARRDGMMKWVEHNL